ncbi:MFS transporter [Kitasatospora viridis]
MVWAAHSSSLIALLAGNSTAQIATHFRTTQIAWFSLAPSLLSILVAPAIYWAATIYGKRRVMMIVAGVAIVGDLIAAVATDYPVLVLGRAISGVYSGAAVLTYAITRDVFPKRSVGQASGALAGGVALVGFIGPFMSAWILDSAGYRGSLWAMVGITALTLVMLLVFIPESPVREPRKPFDWIGGLLLGAGLTAAVYGLGQGTSWGWTSGRVLGLIIGGLTAIVAFLFVEGKVAHPVFPVTLLRRRPVWSMIIVTSLVSSAMSVGTVGYLLALMPHIPRVSAGLGFTATHYAVIGLPSSVVMLATAVYGGSLARRHDPRLLLAAGSALFAVGMAITAVYHHTANQIMFFGLPGSVGMGLIITASPILVISAVKPAEQALGNGAQGMVSGLIGAFITQLAYVVLAQNAHSVRGIQFYSDASFTNAYWLFVGVGVVGAAATFLMPRMKRMDEVEAGQAAATS